MTASPGSATYQNDILGNRLWKNRYYSTATRYDWDDAGRMLKTLKSTGGAEYMYRPDGMRIKKVTGLQLVWNGEEGSSSGFYDEEVNANFPTYRYRYDGQMCFEEDFTEQIPGEPPTVSVTGTSYALGARGIDMMRTFTYNPYTQVRTYDTNGKSFPIYDGHGNMIATLGRSSSTPFYTLGNERTYDVWGDVRTTNGTGDPNTRYCANLGHKQDDESDLIYMRARYYEPGTGRFISEDAGRHGLNWYTFASNNPVSRSDITGNWDAQDAMDLSLMLIGFLTSESAATTMYAAGKFFIFTAVGGIVGLVFGAMALCDAYDAVAAIYKDKFSTGGATFKIEKGRFKGGALTEALGFATAWYALLNFMYRHMEIGLVEN